MNYLRFLLLTFLLLTTSEVQSANYATSDSIYYSKRSADSTIVKEAKNRREATILGITGAAVAVTGILYGGILVAVLGGILIVVAIIKTKNRSKNQPQKIPHSSSSDSSKKGIASTGRAILLVLAGIGIAALAITGLTYLVLSNGI